MRTGSGIMQIAPNPSYGAIGMDLPVVELAKPDLVVWGSTTATSDQYLYASVYDILEEGDLSEHRGRYVRRHEAGVRLQRQLGTRHRMAA
jgi:hypothetical protein